MTTRRIVSATRIIEIRNDGNRRSSEVWFGILGLALGLEKGGKG